MRAISPIANYSIQLVEAVPKRGLDKSGTVVEFSDTKPILAQFTRGGLTEWEQVAALEHFNFSGLPEGVNPLSRVSMYDTEAAVQHVVDQGEREAMLKIMDERLTYLGQLFPSEFIVVDKPASPTPWPTYDKTPINDVVDEETGRITLGLLSMLEQSGISPQDARLFEVENQNREEVVALLEAVEAQLASGKELPDAIDAVRVGESVPEDAETISVAV